MTPFDPKDGALARKRAREATGIEREESTEFITALDAYYHFARLKAPTEAGFLQIDGLVHRLLVNRLRFAEDIARHPEILDEDVTDPIVVMGFPRSGTTVLQRMMSADPAMQSLKLWRLLNPAPFPEERDGSNPSARMEFAEEITEAIRIHNPALHAAHPNVADDADEDWYLHHLTFQHVGQVYTGLPDLDYLAYLRIGSRQPSYLYVADLLRYLQWQDGGRRNRRWVLKSPVHIGNIEEILAAHPAATFVYPRRDFQTVVASFCYTLEVSLKPSLSLPPHDIGRITLDYWVEEMGRFQETRARLGERLKLIEVPYNDLLSDPITHIKGYFEQAGVAMTEAGEQAIRAWIADNPAGKHGINTYSLERYGLTPADIEQAFKFYTSSGNITEITSHV